MDFRPVFRFAPSPNGDLHLGHALSALTGLEMARRMGGRFLVRIEDIDVSRARDVYVSHIFEDLAWLGIAWETQVLRQSEHFDDYRAAAAKLDRLGLLYPCFATRAELAAKRAARPEAVDPDGAPLMTRDPAWSSDDDDRRRLSGEPYGLRLDMVRALSELKRRQPGTALTFTAFEADGSQRQTIARPERWGDAVIVRKDIPASYHLSVVVDDARQGVTHITRGLDLRPATDLHRLLQVLLELPEPLYHHHRLITDAAGRKLAKSAGDVSLRAMRQAGLTPSDVRLRIGFG